MEKLVKQTWAGALFANGSFDLVVAAVHFDRRPAGTDGQGPWVQSLERAGPVNNVATDDGQYRLDAFDLFLGHREVIRRQHRKVGELTGLDGTLLGLLA